MRYPVTPDGHYFVVRGRLWRCTNPHLSATQRQKHVDMLMHARRDVRDHKSDPAALADARQRVQAAKVALGERGPAWWGDDAATYDRCLVKNTPYADWYATLPDAAAK